MGLESILILLVAALGCCVVAFAIAQISMQLSAYEFVIKNVREAKLEIAEGTVLEVFHTRNAVGTISNSFWSSKLIPFLSDIKSARASSKHE
jgi:hypothetical protein